MSLPARVSLVTLGVTDVRRSTAFYRALGWEVSPASVEGEVTFLRSAGALLALWGAADLAADAGLPDRPAPAFRGVALAVNLAGPAEVDEAAAAVVAAGGSVVKPPEATAWGGYSGYVADPDGHLWELAHNPGWPLDERGLPRLP